MVSMKYQPLYVLVLIDDVWTVRIFEKKNTKSLK